MYSEHLATSSEASLQICRVDRDEIPSFRRNFLRENATHPRAPTSIVKKWVFQGVSWALMSGINFLWYRCVFRSSAARIPSSAGHVSSQSITTRESRDQMMISGRSFEAHISGGNVILLSVKSTSSSQSVLESSRLLSLERFELALVLVCTWPAGMKLLVIGGTACLLRCLLHWSK